MKTCRKRLHTLSISLERCPECYKVWQDLNREKSKLRSKNWYLANPEKANLAVNAWRSLNKEKYQVKHKAWHEANIERQKNNIKRWIENNPGKIRIKNALWYQQNSEHKRAHSVSYNKKNPGIRNALSAKYRATKLFATPKWLTEQHIKQVDCYYIVAKWVESILNEPIEVDHIVPLQGENVSGLHVPWNLQLLTEKENIRKSNK